MLPRDNVIIGMWALLIISFNASGIFLLLGSLGGFLFSLVIGLCCLYGQAIALNNKNEETKLIIDKLRGAL